MSSDQNKPNNVIQFPGRRKEAEVKPQAEAGSPIPSTPEKIAAGKPPVAPKAKKKSKKTLAGTVLAIILASGAVNRFAFETRTQSFDFISDSRTAGPAGRAIASVEQYPWARDAQWEKETAEKLASPALRSLASTNIGRPATLEEKLRWGTLEETKYTITYRPESRQIRSILLQGEGNEPSYVLDRAAFLKTYGTLFESDFQSAALKSVETINEKTVESYTLFDKNKRPMGEARFELDRHKRLISLKVESPQSI